MTDWKAAKEYDDRTDHKADRMARIAFDRREIQHAFRPQTMEGMIVGLRKVCTDSEIGVVLLPGSGPSPTDGKWAYFAGGDQSVHGRAGCVDKAGAARPGVLERRHPDFRHYFWRP